VKKLEAELGRRVIAYSSVTGDGREKLWKRLLHVSSIDGSETQTRPEA